MESAKERELFDHLCRMPRVKEWFQEKLDEQVKILVVNPHDSQLRTAQGRAQSAQEVIDKLNAAEAAAKKRPVQ